MTRVFLERRRAAAAAAWNLDGGLVLVAAGDELPVPGRGDRTYPFRAHSEYLYLADRERPGGVLAYAPAGGWIEFVAPVTADELLWSGLEGDREGVPEGTRPLGELEAWVAGRPVRRLGAVADADVDVELRDALIHVRRPKDGLELERMRTAAEATRAGFEQLSRTSSLEFEGATISTLWPRRASSSETRLTYSWISFSASHANGVT